MANYSYPSIHDILYGDEYADIRAGFMTLIVGWLISFVSSTLAVFIGIGVGIYFTISFLDALLSGEWGKLKSYIPDRSDQIQTTIQAPVTEEPTIADRIKEIHIKNSFKCPSCGATVLPTYTQCKHCGSVLVAAADLPKPEKWGNVEVGQNVQVKHPKEGTLNLPVVHRVYYGELWQAQMKPDVPWTLTGNYFVGLGLAENVFLMHWQNNCYLLDLHQPLTDMSINRDFAPHARKFAASNQARNVLFAYQEDTWGIYDIGRFRIEFAEGDGVRVGPGAVGRFIHAKDRNRDQRVLVIEDYQTGGSGLDTLWIGYRIEEKDMKL